MQVGLYPVSLDALTDDVQRLSIVEPRVDESVPKELLTRVYQIMQDATQDYPVRICCEGVTAYVGSLRKTRKIFFSSNDTLLFEGSQGVRFSSAYMYSFTPDAVLIEGKVRKVVEIGLAKDSPSAARRAHLMMHLANKVLFPKNYGQFSNEKEYIFFQEMAESDLLTVVNDESRKLSEEDKYAIAKRLIEAAIALATHNVVHRDLTLDNLLVFRGMQVKVTDFGFAHYIRDTESQSRICGSANILAPEIVRWMVFNENKPEMGPHVDIWSIGLILYCLFEDQIPLCEHYLYELDEIAEHILLSEKAQKLLQQSDHTEEELDDLCYCLKRLGISDTNLEATLSSLSKKMDTLKQNHHRVALQWSQEIDKLPSRPEEITTIEDLINAMLQKKSEDRISAKEAYQALINLKHFTKES